MKPRPADLDPAGVALWEDYLRRWTLWNHVRTAGALAAFVLFVLAMARGM